MYKRPDITERTVFDVVFHSDTLKYEKETYDSIVDAREAAKQTIEKHKDILFCEVVRVHRIVEDLIERNDNGK